VVLPAGIVKDWRQASQGIAGWYVLLVSATTHSVPQPHVRMARPVLFSTIRRPDIDEPAARVRDGSTNRAVIVAAGRGTAPGRL